MKNGPLEMHQVKILHIPGHTLGHICFFFEKEEGSFYGRYFIFSWMWKNF